MQETRRKFLLKSGAAIVAASLDRTVAGDPVVPNPPDIRDLLAQSGFDSNSGDAALLAVIADPHIMLAPEYPNLYTEKWDDSLINDINTLVPNVTDLAIAGDLIIHHSVNIGGYRHPSHVTRAINEFRLARTEMERFRRDMRIWAVPGNHDTDAFETDADLWRQQMQTPPYQKTVLGGVPVFFLNSGNGGMLNAGQLAWFKSEVKTISSNQEVVIVAHHPSFFHLWAEAGLKRILTDAFAGHQAVVWLLGGHGHRFEDMLFNHRGTRFVQMEVTAAHPKFSNDGKSPGYIMLALQDGRVKSRIFRTVAQSGFVPKPDVSQMTSKTVRWPFDGVTYPVAVFEEGFYDRTNHLVEFNAVDLGCHFVFCKSVTIRIRPSRYFGKVKTLVLAADISPSMQPPPTCRFSISGADGTWLDVPFPAAKGQGLYTINLPEDFRNADTAFVKIATIFTKHLEGFYLSGWALAADEARLTQYEKWISRRYRTLVEAGENSADSLTPGSRLSNIVNFGFNLPTGFSGPTGQPALNATSPDPVGLPSSVLPSSPSITGLPQYTKTFRQVVELRFARRTPASDPGIVYEVEHSSDLVYWKSVPEESLVLTPIEPGWEEVAFTLPVRAYVNGFCRVKVTGTETAGGAFNIWSRKVAVATGTPGDLNGDRIDDLLQFAFDLESGGGPLRPYDPERPLHKAGMPVQTTRMARLSRIVFPRMRANANPGVLYLPEKSTDLSTWQVLGTGEYSEQVIQTSGDWEEVEIIVLDEAHRQRFYRIKLELESPLPS